LFYPVGREGSGRWAVDRERAGTLGGGAGPKDGGSQPAKSPSDIL